MVEKALLDKEEIIMLSKSLPVLQEIWEGIVHKYATGDEILIFLDAYEQSPGYEILSDEARSRYVVFKMIVKDELLESLPSTLLYHYVSEFLYGFGWNLESEL